MATLDRFGEAKKRSRGGKQRPRTKVTGRELELGRKTPSFNEYYDARRRVLERAKGAPLTDEEDAQLRADVNRIIARQQQAQRDPDEAARQFQQILQARIAAAERRSGGSLTDAQIARIEQSLTRELAPGPKRTREEEEARLKAMAGPSEEIKPPEKPRRRRSRQDRAEVARQILDERFEAAKEELELQTGTILTPDEEEALRAELRQIIRERRGLGDAGTRGRARLGDEKSVTGVPTRRAPKPENDPEVRDIDRRLRLAEDELRKTDEALQQQVPSYRGGGAPPLSPVRYERNPTRPGPMVVDLEPKAHRDWRKARKQAEGQAAYDFEQREIAQREAEKQRKLTAREKARLRVELRDPTPDQKRLVDEFQQRENREPDQKERKQLQGQAQSPLDRVRATAREAFDAQRTEPDDRYPEGQRPPLTPEQQQAIDEHEKVLHNAAPLFERYRKLASARDELERRRRERIDTINREQMGEREEVLALRRERDDLFDELSRFDSWHPSDPSGVPPEMRQKARRYQEVSNRLDQLRRVESRVKREREQDISTESFPEDIRDYVNRVIGLKPGMELAPDEPPPGEPSTPTEGEDFAAKRIRVIQHRTADAEEMDRLNKARRVKGLPELTEPPPGRPETVGYIEFTVPHVVEQEGLGTFHTETQDITEREMPPGSDIYEQNAQVNDKTYDRLQDPVVSSAYTRWRFWRDDLAPAIKAVNKDLENKAITRDQRDAQIDDLADQAGIPREEVHEGAADPEAHVERLREEFRDAFFGDTPIGEKAYGMYHGDVTMVGMPTGQGVRGFEGQGTDLDVGSTRVQPRRRQKVDLKPPGRAPVPGSNPDVDVPEHPIDTLKVVGQRDVQVEDTRDVIRPARVFNGNQGTVKVKLRDHNDKVVAEMPSIVATRGRRGRATPDNVGSANLGRAVAQAKRILGSPREFFRWPRGTPWAPFGPGPGRFRAHFDIHLIPNELDDIIEIHATPFGTEQLGDIIDKNPSDVAEPMRAVTRRNPGDNLLGAALSVAQGMARRGRNPDKVARVFIHRPGGGSPEHIRDVRGGGKLGRAAHRVGGAGEFTDTGRLQENEPFQEAFANNLFQRVKRRIREAHSRFQMESLRRLYPDLAGTLLDQRYEIERSRDEEYLLRMEGRVRRKIEAAISDPNLSALEKARKARAALGQERHYFRRHLSETAWRMARNAEIVRLKEAGEPGAFWLLDKGLKEHTADCLAMEGRWWPWAVLNVVNPANRHPGCGCRLISETEARSRGLAIKRGYRSASWRDAIPDGEELTEAVESALDELEEYSPDQPRIPKGVPGGGRWIEWLRAGLPNDFSDVLDDIIDAAGKGDTERTKREQDRLYDLIKELYPADEQAAPLEVAAKLRAAVENPSGGRVEVGRGVAQAPITSSLPRNLARGWHGNGYGWQIEDSRIREQMGKIQGVALLGNNQAFAKDHAIARELETRIPELRRSRVDENGDLIPDDSPLGVTRAERKAAGLNIPTKRGLEKPTRYANVDSRNLGEAAETLIDDVAAQMAGLRYFDPGDSRRDYRSATGKKAPIDWIIDSLALEVKSEALRDVIPGTNLPSPGIDESELKEKRADLANLNRQREAQGLEPLRPVLVMVVTDLNNDTGHVFAMEYADPDQAFSPRRIPQAAGKALFDGTITPGQPFHPEGGAGTAVSTDPYVFVGSFRLRYNPMISGPAHLGTEEEVQRIRTQPTRPVSVGIPETIPDRVTPRISGKEQTRQNVADRRQLRVDRDLAIAQRVRELQAKGEYKDQAQVAREFRVSQPTLSRILQRHGVKVEQKVGVKGQGKKAKAAKAAKEREVAPELPPPEVTGEPEPIPIPEPEPSPEPQVPKVPPPPEHPAHHDEEDPWYFQPEERVHWLLDKGLREDQARKLVERHDTEESFRKMLEIIEKLRVLPQDGPERTKAKRKLLEIFVETGRLRAK